MSNSKIIKKLLCGITFLLAITFLFGYEGTCQYVKANEITEELSYDYELTEPFIDIANSSVSYSGEIYDYVEWKIKLVQEYEDVSLDMTLRAPNGNIISINNSSSAYEIDENGCYTLSYWVSESGAGDGVYQINRIEINVGDDYCTVTNGYKGMDLSSLSFTVNGQKQDITAPVIDKDNIVICKEEKSYGTQVQVQIPIKEDESGIQELHVGYGYYSEDWGGWLFGTSRGTIAGTVRPNPLGVATEWFDLSDFEEGIVYAINFVKVIDWAGNTAIVNLAPDNTEELKEINSVPEKYRFTTDNLHVHTYFEEWTIDMLPTCSEDGWKSRHCTTPGCIGACDFEDFSYPVEHVYGEWKVTKEATCKEAGLKESYCSACEEKITEEIPIIEQHTYGEWVITKEATYNENGSRERNCSVCGTKETEGITATGYTKGVELEKGDNIYVISAINGTTGTVTYKGATQKAKTVKVPDKVTIDGITYKVTSIANNAFANNKKVTKVVIGKNITSIGKNAFKKCAKLKTIEIKSTKLSKIGANAFYGAKKLTKITLKTTKLTKKSIGKNALKGTNKKLVIKVPKSKVKKYKNYFKNKGNKTVKVKK